MLIAPSWVTCTLLKNVNLYKDADHWRYAHLLIRSKAWNFQILVLLKMATLHGDVDTEHSTSKVSSQWNGLRSTLFLVDAIRQAAGLWFLAPSLTVLTRTHPISSPA